MSFCPCQRQCLAFSTTQQQNGKHHKNKENYHKSLTETQTTDKASSPGYPGLCMPLSLSAFTTETPRFTSNPSLRAHCRRSPGTTSGAVGTPTRADACCLADVHTAPSAFEPPPQFRNVDFQLIHQFLAFALHLVTIITVFLDHDAWHVVPTDNRKKKRSEHRFQNLPCTCHCRFQRQVLALLLWP